MPFTFLTADYFKHRQHRPPEYGHDLFKPNSSMSVSRFWAVGVMWVFMAGLVWLNFGASYLPTPWGILAAFPDLWFRGGLGPQIWTSFSLNLVAVSVMFAVSYSVAVATVMPAFRPLAMLVSSGRFNGFVGMPFLFMAIFHDSYWVKVALLVYGVGAFTTLSLVGMIHDIPKDRFDHSRTLRMSEWRVVWEVVILGRFAEVLDIVAVNAAMIWMMLPMVEGRFRDGGGVGALMENEAKHFNMEAVFCALLVVLAIGLLQDYGIGFIKRTLCPYSCLGVERQ